MYWKFVWNSNLLWNKIWSQNLKRYFFHTYTFFRKKRDFKNHNNKQFCFKETFCSNHSPSSQKFTAGAEKLHRGEKSEENETLLNIIGKTCCTNEYIFLRCFVIYCCFWVQSKFWPTTKLPKLKLGLEQKTWD